MKDKIKFEEFLEVEKKVEIIAGKVESVSEIEKSKKVIKLTVDFGDNDIRSVVTNIKPELVKLTPEGDHFSSLLIGKTFLFVTNLEPVTIMGVVSTAMILPGSLETTLLTTNAQAGEKLL